MAQTLSFNQVQLILNAFYLWASWPFVCTKKPTLSMEDADIESLREQLRAGKVPLLKLGLPYDDLRKRNIELELTSAEIRVIVEVLDAVLAEATTGQPHDVCVVVGPIDQLEELANVMRRWN